MRIAGMVVAAAVVMGSLTPLPSPLGAQPATSASDLCDAEDVATFADVNPGDYGAAYILCMKAVGLSLGKGDGSFGAGDNLTRAQMASFVVRLWRDILGRQCPDDTVSPFTDVDPAGPHTSNIDCVYGLGITKGTTTTTYSPVAPLTASQISRFLLRTYKKAGNTCPEAASELDEALACLEELRVIPTKAEGSSSDAVTRDQMAVYLIGLWHNLSGRGLPPQPPTKAAFDTTTTVAEEETTGADTSYTAIATGSEHSCAIATDRTLTCWGNNSMGQAEPPGGQYTAIATGRVHSCAIATDRTLTCWGNNSMGQAEPPGGQYTAIATGRVHSCAIATDRTLTCWGNNSMGQAEPPGGQYTAIATGRYHSCAIATDRTLTCWGATDHGRLVPPGGQYRAIATGRYHSCAIATDRTLTCWGNNSMGQIGRQDQRGSGHGVPPAGQYTAIAAGSYHSCAIATDGTLTCWGANWSGRADPPAGQYTAIATGSEHSCAIATDGTLTCWGANWSGRADPPAGQYTGIATSTNTRPYLSGLYLTEQQIGPDPRPPHDRLAIILGTIQPNEDLESNISLHGIRINARWSVPSKGGPFTESQLRFHGQWENGSVMYDVGYYDVTGTTLWSEEMKFRGTLDVAVRYRNAIGWGPWSNEVSVTAPRHVGPVRNPSVTRSEDGFTISWDPPTGTTEVLGYICVGSRSGVTHPATTIFQTVADPRVYLFLPELTSSVIAKWRDSPAVVDTGQDLSRSRVILHDDLVAREAFGDVEEVLIIPYSRYGWGKATLLTASDLQAAPSA